MTIDEYSMDFERFYQCLSEGDYPSLEKYLKVCYGLDPSIIDPLRCNEYTRDDGWIFAYRDFPIYDEVLHNMDVTRVRRKHFPVEKFKDVLRKMLTSLGYEEDTDFSFSFVNDSKFYRGKTLRLHYNSYFTTPYPCAVDKILGNYILYAFHMFAEGRI